MVKIHANRAANGKSAHVLGCAAHLWFAIALLQHPQFTKETFNQNYGV